MSCCSCVNPKKKPGVEDVEFVNKNREENGKKKFKKHLYIENSGEIEFAGKKGWKVSLTLKINTKTVKFVYEFGSKKSRDIASFIYGKDYMTKT